MEFTWDTTLIVNLVLGIVILFFGILGWQRSKSLVSLYLGIAFGLFGFSHLATLLGLKYAMDIVLIAIRLLAYLLVTYAVYLLAFRKE